MNTVGPYHNRQETYTYFSLPFCKGPKQEISHYHETLGEALQGVELEFSGLEIAFKGEERVMTVYSEERVKVVYSGERVMTVCSEERVKVVYSGERVMTVCSEERVKVVYSGEREL